MTVRVTSVSPTPIRGTMALQTYWPASDWLTDFKYSWLLLLSTCTQTHTHRNTHNTNLSMHKEQESRSVRWRVETDRGRDVKKRGVREGEKTIYI